MSDLWDEVQHRIAAHMDEIHTYFKPGARVTVLVRHPGKPEADFCMTADTLADVAEMVERRRVAAGAN